MAPTARRERLADAAIAVLARSGSRGLTHRAVDRAAGLPEGSTSYYFRTRASLLRAVVERLAALDAAELAQLPDAGGGVGHRLAESVALLVEQLTTTGRDRLLARYELSLEATRRPELREVLAENTAALRRAVAGRLRAAGASDPHRSARELMVLLDGLLLNQLTGLAADHEDGAALRGRVERVLAAAGAWPEGNQP